MTENVATPDGNMGGAREKMMKPLKKDLPQNIYLLVEELRKTFSKTGKSMRAYAKTRHINVSAISRYLDGGRAPSRNFIDNLLSDAGESEERKELIIGLYLAARPDFKKRPIQVRHDRTRGNSEQQLFQKAQQLKADPRSSSSVRILNEEHPQWIASILDLTSPGKCAAAFRHVTKSQMADVLVNMNASHAIEVLRLTDARRAAEALREMSAQQAAQLLEAMPFEQSIDLFSSMDSGRIAEIVQHLSHKKFIAVLEKLPGWTEVLRMMNISHVVGVCRGMTREELSHVVECWPLQITTQIISEIDATTAATVLLPFSEPDQIIQSQQRAAQILTMMDPDKAACIFSAWGSYGKFVFEHMVGPLRRSNTNRGRMAKFLSNLAPSESAHLIAEVKRPDHLWAHHVFAEMESAPASHILWHLLKTPPGSTSGRLAVEIMDQMNEERREAIRNLFKNYRGSAETQ
ncbi:magnesium transporter MgtE N-terminal domain-containing protein [Streptomyces sp. NPDC101152]|uniref:magnesium transporter MgtE N-terminal domain-containing protein n=1 Tax=Streptomyces sp. NPDC101152 TaxID=3366116 RepID=UPI00381CC915